MEISSQLDTPAAFIHGKGPQAIIEQETGCATQPLRPVPKKPIARTEDLDAQKSTILKMITNKYGEKMGCWVHDGKRLSM